MAETPAQTESERFAVRVTADSHFAWLRTRLALERTLMSWMRTATALIGFGFAIVQYLDRLEQVSGARSPYMPHAPQYLGLALIAAGVLGLLFSIRQYRWMDRYLSSGSYAPIAGMKQDGIYPAALPIAVLLIGIGSYAFLAVFLRFM